jgi:hypothetical protein
VAGPDFASSISVRHRLLLNRKVTDVTRRCFDRSSDLISTCKSVLLVISAIAVSSAL